jgi:hypothetical protein
MDGNLSQPRVSTVVLHRPNPVAREMPDFIGFFVHRVQVAEREGLPHNSQKPNKIRHFLHTR